MEFDSSAFHAILANMRILFWLMAALFLLVGCANLPPTIGGVLHHQDCAIHWQPNDFPLEIVVDRRFSPAQQETLHNSVDTWNTEVGGIVFTISREIDWFSRELLSPLPSTVYVLLYDLPEDNVQGLTTLDDERCHINRALVFLDVSVPTGDTRLVLTHELGHALSLAHDVEQQSVMWPYAATSGGQIMPEDVRFIIWEMTYDQASTSVSESSTCR